jgi:hypothetical protein
MHRWELFWSFSSHWHLIDSRVISVETSHSWTTVNLFCSDDLGGITIPAQFYSSIEPNGSLEKIFFLLLFSVNKSANLSPQTTRSNETKVNRIHLQNGVSLRDCHERYARVSLRDQRNWQLTASQNIWADQCHALRCSLRLVSRFTGDDDARKRFNQPLTRHEMQKNGGDGIERRTVGDVRTGVAQYANDTISHGSALLR